ncbi:MAG: 5-methylcytosine-specific restriction endonuclease McrA [Neolewinella sp.]|jgi:5-methylcytosine-specific restriction endonuclease McrA
MAAQSQLLSRVIDVPRTFALAAYHIDHIISEKQDGSTTFGNLTLACRLCNLRKGS